jgi:virginiamycin B lyase
MKRIVFALLSLSLLMSLPPDGVAQEDVTLDEWEVPWERTRPRDPYVGPDGMVWFVGQVGHYAARLDPTTGEFTRFNLDDGTGPHNLIVDSDGTVWYAGNAANHIGKLDPETGEIEKFRMPIDAARDPHTLVFDRSGNIWFTVQQGNYVGHFDKSSGETRLVEAPEAETRRGMGSSRPYGIKMDSNDQPWIALFNTNKIATVDKSSFTMKTFTLPEGARPRRLVIDSRDIVWYVDYARGKLGRLDPETGAVREWDSPSGAEARGYGMAIDDQDRIWYVEVGVQPNMFVGFDAKSEEFVGSYPVPSGAGAIRHMFYHQPTQSIWFGTDSNTVGRAVVGRSISDGPDR